MDEEELKILVAVPAVDIRAVAQALTEAGFRYSLHTANTVEAASDGLGQIGFDFAILGETLPDDGGEALLPHIIGHGIEVPVIFIFDGDMDLSRATNVVRLGVADCFHQSELSSERLERAALTALRFYRAQSKAIRAQKQLTMRALFDPLTDLPNRGLFFARVNRALALSEKDNREVAILAIDLNRFRDVNNVLSHAAGDELLRLVTTRLNNVVRTTDTLARLGADEFAILMPKNASIPAAESMARRVHDAMLPPYTIERQNLGVGSSIGIAVSPHHGSDSSALLRHADLARLAAKRGKQAFVVFAGDDTNLTLHSMSLASDLRNAVPEKQLVLYYQPKISTEDGTVCGVEALTRWNHPEHGMVPPDTFIPLAEQTGLIEPLTQWLLEEAAAQHRSWKRTGNHIPIAVNISAITLQNSNFPQVVGELLGRHSLSGGSVMLEITESAIMSDVAQAARTVNELAEMGVGFSIDDFGTGYTSFSYIGKLPIRKIKVDKSFVFNMLKINDDAAIVRTIVEMGKNLGVNVVAEGVEDEETWNALGTLGCDTCQGYFFSKPVPPDELVTWLDTAPWPVRPRTKMIDDGLLRADGTTG